MICLYLSDYLLIIQHNADICRKDWAISCKILLHYDFLLAHNLMLHAVKLDSKMSRKSLSTATTRPSLSFIHMNDYDHMYVVCEAPRGPRSRSTWKESVLIAIELMFKCRYFGHPDCFLWCKNGPTTMGLYRTDPGLGIRLILTTLGYNPFYRTLVGRVQYLCRPLSLVYGLNPNTTH